MDLDGGPQGARGNCNWYCWKYVQRYKLLSPNTDFWKGLDLGVYDMAQIIQELRPYITEGASLPDTAKGKVREIQLQQSSTYLRQLYVL